MLRDEDGWAWDSLDTARLDLGLLTLQVRRNFRDLWVWACENPGRTWIPEPYSLERRSEHEHACEAKAEALVWAKAAFERGLSIIREAL